MNILRTRIALIIIHGFFFVMTFRHEGLDTVCRILHQPQLHQQPTLTDSDQKQGKYEIIIKLSDMKEATKHDKHFLFSTVTEKIILHSKRNYFRTIPSRITANVTTSLCWCATS